MRWQPGSQWCRWMVASGVLHALLLGGLVLVLGTDTKPAATLRARLVTVVKAVSASAPESRMSATPVPPSVMPASPARPAKAPTPSSPSVRPTAAETSPARQAPPPEAVREIARPPVGSGMPSGTPKDDGASGAPTQLEAAARGVFLMPAGSGSGTGRAGVGAADQGVGAGGSGAGKTGPGGSGQVGGSGTGLASRGGGGGGGSGDGAADLLRSIRRQIERAQIYPEAARREGIQGTVELRFRIAADGSVEAVEILRSSGSGILDEASQQTIRRAAPYPLVRGWIRLPLSYRLDR
jgi:protein TonB